MTALTLAIVVGVLFATGTYLLLRRDAIKLILGLGLLTHGVNLLIFGAGGLKRGQPPIIADKKTFAGDISQFVDPLPQALILTAIVIAFGVTAFTVVLVYRRNSLEEAGDPHIGALEADRKAVTDPFATAEYYESGLDQDPDDYSFLEFSMAEERRQKLAKRKAEEEAGTEKSDAITFANDESVAVDREVDRDVNKAENRKDEGAD